MTREKLWTKDFISISAISFFIFLAYYILLTALPLYLVGPLHEGADKVGPLVTLFLFPAILIRPFAGKWVSRGSQKKILVFSAVAFFVATLLYPLATNLWVLYLLRIIHGITFGIATTVKGTVCAGIIPASRRGEGLSYFSLAMSLAMVFGPYIGLNLANIAAYNTVFILSMIVSAVNIVLSIMMRVPENTATEKSVAEKNKFSFNDIFDKKAAPYAMATFISACAYSGISAFLSLYAKELGLVKAASAFFIIYAAVILVFRPFTGRWADQYGSNKIVYPAIILFAIGMFMVFQTHTGVILMIAGALIGIGYGSVTPIFQTQTISSVEPHRVGIANSLFFNSMDLGMAIGSFVLGYVADSLGYSYVYLTGVVLIVITGVLYWILTKKQEKPQLVSHVIELEKEGQSL